MGKWVQLRAAQLQQDTARNTKAMAQQAQVGSNNDARVAQLEGRVAALEARVQWAIDVIQRLQQANPERHSTGDPSAP